MNTETKYLQWTQEKKPTAALSFSCPYSQSRVYIQKRQLNSKRYVHPNGQSSTIYNSQDKKQPKCQSTDDRVKKMWVKWNIMFVLVAQMRLTLCNPVDCSPPGSPVHGILQGRIPEWVAIPFPRGSSQPRDWTFGFCIVGRFFTIWVTGKAQNGALLSHKKEWKIATCSNMDGEKNKYYMTSLIRGILKIIQMNLYTKQKQTYKCRKRTYGYLRRGGERMIWIMGLTNTNSIYKIDKKQGFTV